MFTYTFVLVVCVHVPEVVDKPVFYSKHGLPHILYPTCVACDCVDEVRATAGYIFHSVISLFCVVAL